MPRPLAVAVLCAATLAVGLLTRAGPLNPPAGPVASTYKTLSEVEPRIAVNAANTPGTATALFRITQPGSYYLTGNLAGVAAKAGIEIAASDVTLDLEGYRLQGIAGSLAGILVSGSQSNVAVRNGIVRGWAGGGVIAATTVGLIADDLRCIGNTGHGIQSGPDAMVRSCYCLSNTQSGILASVPSLVSDSIARANGQNGISTGDHSSVSNSIALGNTGTGLNLGAGALLRGDIAAQNGVGVSASSGLNASDCVSRNNTSHGFFVFGALFSHCLSTVNGGDGFDTDSALIDGCRSTSNTANGVLAGANSLVVHSLTLSNTLYGVHAASGYVQRNLCANDSVNNPGLISEIFFDGAGRIEGNALSTTNPNLWGTGGASNTLMVNNSLAGGFVTTFSGMEGPDISTSNINTSCSPHGNYDLP